MHDSVMARGYLFVRIGQHLDYPRLESRGEQQDGIVDRPTVSYTITGNSGAI
jgi:hypothetical protein